MNSSGTLRCRPLGVLVLFFCFLLLYLAVFRTSSPEVNQSNRVSLRSLLAVCVDAAVRGGNEVRKVRKLADLGQKSKGKTREGIDDPVTSGDLNSHRAMYSALVALYPGMSVVSEEHDVNTYDRGGPSSSWTSFLPGVIAGIPADEDLPLDELTVWIDPLDATKEYTENLLDYVTTMVCVARNGRPIAGVVHLPFQNETYWAWVGKGHSRNLNTDHVDPQNPLKIVVSMSHKGDVEKYVNERMEAKAAVVYDAAGAGFKTLEVVKGRADAYVHTTRIKKWDTCAGNAIIAALGGQMTTLRGDVIDYSNRGSVGIDDGLLASFHADKFKGLMRE